MSWFRRKARAAPEPEISRAQALASRPVKNSQVREEALPDGLVRLAYPVELKPMFARVAERLGHDGAWGHQKKLELDAMGSHAWSLMDGNRDVKQLIAAFVKRYDLHPREAEVALTSFIRELGKRGLIGLR